MSTLTFWYTRIACFVFGCLLLLVMAEVVAGLFERLGSSESALLSYSYAPYRMMKHDKSPWPINNDGFRAPPLETISGNSNDFFDIVFLGASVCMGFGGDNGKSLPELLEKELRDLGLTKARVVNLCQGGAVSEQELIIFHLFGQSLRPELVISFNGANDLIHPKPLGPDDAPNLPYLNSEMASLWKPLTQQSASDLFASGTSLGRRFTFLMRKFKAKYTASEDGVPVEKIVDSYISAMQATSALVKDVGGRHMIVFQPTLLMEKPQSVEERVLIRKFYKNYDNAVSRFQQLQEATISRLRLWELKSGPSVYDLTKTFSGVNQTVYMDSVHFANQVGYPMLLAELHRQGFVIRIVDLYDEWMSKQAE